ncbi:hypothetical protein QC763_309630 [Podospora pseudopauciseta]|uniref:F-box domain-containing protein n=1 Tax=Podospora pseudopauciseta TaxID=2093780 RepID=A0ABR0HHX2_9PEZI|nr:hypothetical protein QC763_309630 [Podospora pseudopauciseta]
MASAQDVLISLPVDILIDIISCLDPVSLIALSQTSKGLRDFINPIEHDFQQRLLALELLPKNGGPELDDYPGYPFRQPKFYLLHETIPQMTNRGRDWWASSWYACFGCMKLLSNAMFDDSELFNTATRKPWMRSSEVQKMALTDWKLATTTESRLSSIQRRAEQDREPTEQYRQQYQTSFHWNKAVNRELNDDEDVEEVRRKHENCIEETNPHIVGKARHERRCVECKFQRNLYRDRPAHQLFVVTPMPQSFSPERTWVWGWASTGCSPVSCQKYWYHPT